MILEILLSVIICLGFGAGFLSLYRMHGGAKPKLPWKFDEILIGLFILVPVLILVLSNKENDRTKWAAFLATFAGAILKVKGHGQYMTLKFLPPWPRRIEPETWDIFLKPVFGEDPRTAEDWTDLHHSTKAARLKAYGLEKLYRRCLSGLFISGASVSVGLVAVLAYFGYWWLAIPTFIGFGASKALSYAYGWKKGVPTGNPKDLFDEPTELGEAGSGLGVGIVIGLLTSYFLFFI